MNKLFFAFISAVAFLLEVGGCAEAPSQPWSTKAQSVDLSSIVAPVLAVSPAVALMPGVLLDSYAEVRIFESRPTAAVLAHAVQEIGHYVRNGVGHPYS